MSGGGSADGREHLGVVRGQVLEPDPSRQATSSGRRSWYCRSMAARRASLHSRSVALAVAVDEAVLGDPVELVGAGAAGRSRGPSSTASPARRTSRADRLAHATARPNRVGPGAPGSKSSHWISRAVTLAPSVSSDRLCEREVVADTGACAGTGRANADRSPIGTRPRSSASTIEVVPSLRKVATSLRLASPAMTCSAPVLLGVGVGLVAGVDDRALQRGLEARPPPRRSRPAA